MATIVVIAVIAVSLGFSFVYATLIVLQRRRIPFCDLNLPSYPKTNVFMTLRNLDDGLEENLTSVFTLDYPDYDIYFGIDDINDPCVKVAERVRARFPRLSSTIVEIGNSQVHNPKVNKLAFLERQSDAPLIWVLDSDVRVEPQTLRALVSEHLLGAKIVFSPIRCRGARTFGAIIEMSYVNFFMSGNILTSWKLLRQRVIVGKSLLIERKALDAIGGFAHFIDVLAEDYLLGETFIQNGFSVRCNYTWIDNIKEVSTIKEYFDRMNRWAKLRFNLKRPIYMLEILLNPLALVLLFLPVLKINAIPLALAVIFLRVALEYIVFFSINAGKGHQASVIMTLAPAVLIKDLMLFVVYFLPFFSNTVTWRGNSIKIGKKTQIICTPQSLLYDNA
jgi:ceramide glucosyltransferase